MERYLNISLTYLLDAVFRDKKEHQFNVSCRRSAASSCLVKLAIALIISTAEFNVVANDC